MRFAAVRRAALSPRLALLLAGMSLAGRSIADDQSEVALAVNVGGPAYVSTDGIAYLSDRDIKGGAKKVLDKVLGTQDPDLYTTYREGDLKGTWPLDDGTYDVTLAFAEPQTTGARRLFDVFIEGRSRLNKLDVQSARDGRARSALTVTFPNVRVRDGHLDLHLKPVRNAALLSAILVRRPHVTPPMQMLWHDEFNEKRLDPKVWNIVNWPPRRVNDEDQAYTGSPGNLRIESGHLVIEARHEDLGRAHYTSARINTHGKRDIRYGRIEVRARLPAGRGTWPAIWMLPSDPFKYAENCKRESSWQGSKHCDAWPNSGEIDIMEHVGYQQGHIHATVHTGAYNWGNWQQRKGRVVLFDVTRRYHTYALEWRPDRIDVFVDNILYFTYMNEHQGWQAWPFNQPFFLILNLAVGGSWGRAGGPIDNGALPAQFLIDYVRVYRFTH